MAFRWPRTPWSLQPTKQSIHSSGSQSCRRSRGLGDWRLELKLGSTPQRIRETFPVLPQRASLSINLQPLGKYHCVPKAPRPTSHTTDNLAGTSVAFVPYPVGNPTSPAARTWPTQPARINRDVSRSPLTLAGQHEQLCPWARYIPATSNHSLRCCADKLPMYADMLLACGRGLTGSGLRDIKLA